MARLLDDDEITRQLTDLPGVVRGAVGTLTLGLQAPTFADAVRLINEVADAAEELNHHPDVDLRWRTVVFTLSTHSTGGVTQLDIELAHRIVEAARRLGAGPLPAPQRVEIALDCVDADRVRPFWAAALGWREQETPEGGSELQDPSDRGPVLWFQQMDAPRPGRGRFHLDVHVPDDQAQGRLKACLDAGGRLVTDVHAPSWWVLADPEENELCICTTPR